MGVGGSSTPHPAAAPSADRAYVGPATRCPLWRAIWLSLLSVCTARPPALGGGVASYTLPSAHTRSCAGTPAPLRWPVPEMQGMHPSFFTPSLEPLYSPASLHGPAPWSCSKQRGLATCGAPSQEDPQMAVKAGRKTPSPEPLPQREALRHHTATASFS